MSSADIIRVVSVGPDWMTLTAKGEAQCTLLMFVYSGILENDMPKDTIEEDWFFQGYRGKSAGPIKCGVRGKDEAVMIISGQSATDWLELVRHHTGNVTRLDLQITLDLGKPEPGLAHRAYKLLEEMQVCGARQRTLRYMSSPTGDTLYVGSRKSAVMLRLYDKGNDLSLAELGRYWRYEVEFKRDSAKRAWSRLIASGDSQDWTANQVIAEYRKRGLKVAVPNSRSVAVIETGARVSTAEGKLAWLQKCVAPVVVQLLNLGYEEQVLVALKLNHIYKLL